MVVSNVVVVTGAVAVALLILASSSAPATADEGHATFYGDDIGDETMEGACGYADMFKEVYGLETTALSVALFNEGWSCGSCYEIRCEGSTYCRPGAVVTVTATNLCPANYSKPRENWCNPPLKHFDLTKPMFLRLVTDYRVGIIPINFRRVPCAKSGGVRFEMMGNQWWVAVLVFNVGGAGDVRTMAVKGSRDGQWLDMSRNWGQLWNVNLRLVGQGLSFRVETSDGRALVLNDVVPPTWTPGQTFQANGQF
ncbi:hypothetical protein GUJ93_ZPchr0008g11782 [Zizania palustris]|uniref:Expansin n=1 Tax=Zizania palustris TaxID=103762 RepID=A0A8J5RID8_ZIZPA|nr:hypothetical protein GUJ93_ZPchr0008g11782 [Zizania palustris]